MYIFLLFALASYSFAAPLIKAGQQATAIPGKWIVKLKGDVTTSAMTSLKAMISTEPDHEYSMAGFRGFAGTLSEKELARLGASHQVEYIQQDATVHAYYRVEQENATWGLARISSEEPGSTSYFYDDTAGEGTCSYIIDTGIYVEHPDFGGRAEWLGDFSGEDLLVDEQGHGTHVAGIVGSATYGVAKKTKLYAVKVLDSYGSGTNAGVLAGINFVVKDAKTRDCPKGFSANLSLGGYKSTVLNQAVAAAVRSGIFFAVAAGNEGMDAKYSSPASEPSACTVGATHRNDTFVSWSNFGPLVDVLSPGANITSTWNDGSIETLSGTSMSAPFVAGMAACMMGFNYTDVSSICDMIGKMAAIGVVKGVPKNTKNLLLQNGHLEVY
ncbi:cephalosporin C acetylhydrolase [Dothidotthia symphoricarpi CBS 119687]|uniref:Cephalosporin C acetylhydrolase n=1 Tax=Dothidotthia symphoricarpi CBS 119687 TaxID=1392245 RepID=A0A6A6AH25_9PLEO|nr:cephalosporin C acetylhydrolase [Dothidotthia symphoricarpi CBS 119687]KAF2130368.1 cephalosporin C acetylhydrolase [Dothidotthia symphoricarpi CBS 119687]